ncbi:MAG: cyclase family protein, partial [Chloroflexota bacterium]|nr:cyclase family protein [Chloroflexota bacterium]
MKLIDLSSHVYSGMMRLPIFPEVAISPIVATARGDSANVSELRTPTHAGTHVDAPFHFVPGGRTIDQISLEQLCGPAVVIPIHRRAEEPISPEDLAAADVRPGDIVLLHTGWSEKFETPEYQLHPYLLPETARWLVEKKAKMLGVDGVNVDMPIGHRPADYANPVHRILL